MNRPGLVNIYAVLALCVIMSNSVAQEATDNSQPTVPYQNAQIFLEVSQTIVLRNIDVLGDKVDLVKADNFQKTLSEHLADQKNLAKFDHDLSVYYAQDDEKTHPVLASEVARTFMKKLESPEQITTEDLETLRDASTENPESAEDKDARIILNMMKKLEPKYFAEDNEGAPNFTALEEIMQLGWPWCIIWGCSDAEENKPQTLPDSIPTISDLKNIQVKLVNK